MQVFIDNVTICNAQGNTLPEIIDTLTPVYVKVFSPAPLGDSGKLFFNVFYSAHTGSLGGTRFFIKAKVMDPEFYLFTDNQGDYMELQFDASPNQNNIMLEFKLKNLTPVSKNILARLLISTRTENSSQQRVLLKAKN